MPLPALLGAAAPLALKALPYVATAGGAALGGYLANRQSAPQQNQMTVGVPGSKPSGNFFTGYNAQTQQLPRFTPEQQQALSQLLSQGLSDFNFPAIENAARSNFQSQTIPSIAERFASMGSGNRGSSGYGAALGRAGAGFEQQLAALKSQHGLGLLGLGLTPSFENIYIPQTTGLVGTAGQGLAQGVGAASPFLLDMFIRWLQGGGQQSAEQPQLAQKQGEL